MAGTTLRSPTCLACLRRITTGNGAPGATASTVFQQTRAKTYNARPTDRGVLVRLLEDIPKFGRRHAIFRVDRGRMRNLWYHKKQAEYMTAARFQELGLSKSDIGERDFLFGALSVEPEAQSQSQPSYVPVEEETPKIKVEHLTPAETRLYLATLVPEVLTFYGKLIHARTDPALEAESAQDERAATLSPLIARAPEPEAPKEEPKDPLAIFGSVSLKDVVREIKRSLSVDPDASRVTLEVDDVKFFGLKDGEDRVKRVGRWEVEISVGEWEAPIRKLVEVLPEEEIEEQE